MVGELARVIALPDDPATTYRTALSGRKAVAWADPLPLADMKAIGRALECSVNDVLMSTVAGALGAGLRQQDQDVRGVTIRAIVPEAELYKYAAALRSMTQGRAHHTRKPAGYEAAPEHITQRVKQEREAAEASKSA